MYEMIFCVSVRGFDVPDSILSGLGRDSNFRVIPEKRYFYSAETFKTQSPEEIDTVLGQALDLAEPYADAFRAICEDGGTVELYITFRSRTSGGFDIPRTTVKRISALNMSISID